MIALDRIQLTGLLRDSNMLRMKKIVAEWLLHHGNLDGIRGWRRKIFFINDVLLRDWAMSYLYKKLSFIAWVLRRWGDREFKKGNLNNALYFYERCTAVSQNPDDYVQMLKCDVSSARAKMLVRLLYKYELK